MFRCFIAAASLLLCCSISQAQASFTALGTPYTQDFNSLTAGADAATYPSWANNTTLTGWYIDEAAGAADDLPVIEASYTTMNNGGSAYIYRSGGDCSLGSRAAGSTNTCYYGIRLVNNTGAAISSIYVTYAGEQWTIAENNSNINTITVDYQVGASITSLTAGTWTNVPGLSFTQIYNNTQSAGMGGSACGGSSNQCLALNGNTSSNRTAIAACISVSIPAGNEIMLRWVDIDNAANDHHMQIDDLSIWPFDIACSTILPVELTRFELEAVANDARLEWETASEKDNSHFVIERAGDDGIFAAIGNVEGKGNSSQPQEYTFTDPGLREGIYYYRLRQMDYNGESHLSPIRAIVIRNSEAIEFTASAEGDGIAYRIGKSGTAETMIEVRTVTGQLLYEAVIGESTSGILPVSTAGGTLCFVRLISGELSITRPVIR